MAGERAYTVLLDTSYKLGLHVTPPRDKLEVRGLQDSKRMCTVQCRSLVLRSLVTRSLGPEVWGATLWRAKFCE